jgi:hypothetical protein
MAQWRNGVKPKSHWIGKIIYGSHVDPLRTNHRRRPRQKKNPTKQKKCIANPVGLHYVCVVPNTGHTLGDTKMSETTDLSTVAYNGVSYAVSEFPAVTQHFLMSRGLTHVLGNEIASKVTGWVKKQTVTNEDGTVTEPSAEAIAEKTAELTAERVASLRSGEISMRASGPRGPKDPVADKAWSLAYDIVIGAATAQNRFGASAPKDRRISKTDLETMATNYLATQRDALMEKARRAIEASKRDASKSELSLDALLAA